MEFRLLGADHRGERAEMPTTTIPSDGNPSSTPEASFARNSQVQTDPVEEITGVGPQGDVDLPSVEIGQTDKVLEDQSLYSHAAPAEAVSSAGIVAEEIALPDVADPGNAEVTPMGNNVASSSRQKDPVPYSCAEVLKDEESSSDLSEYSFSGSDLDDVAPAGGWNLEIPESYAPSWDPDPHRPDVWSNPRISG